MPMTSPIPLSPVRQKDFAKLDYEVMHHEHHLRALLGLTPLRTIQWVNLARRRVQLASLNK